MHFQKKLERPSGDIIKNNLFAMDFLGNSVHVQFKDGSDLRFQCAFYVSETHTEGAIHRVAVFREHCGNYEFWIDSDDQISESSSTNLEHQSSPENLAWNSMAPVGREFGSLDFDRLMNEDAEKFASDLSRWIQQSRVADVPRQLEKHELSDVLNVQLALRKLGQDVTVDESASVWKNYSRSLMAHWMTGAETVQSAVQALYLYCPREDEKSL